MQDRKVARGRPVPRGGARREGFRSPCRATARRSEARRVPSPGGALGA